MIRTGLKYVPWFWIVLLCVNTGVYHFASQSSHGAPMQQLLSKFTRNPFYLTLIGMMGPGLTLLVSTYVSWKSDRIWTRFGRRKPFMLFGWGMLIPLAFVAPFLDNLWLLLILIFLWTFALDVAYEGVNTPLFYEVIPTSQRGRGAALKKGTQKTFSLIFNYFVFAQFGHTYDMKLPGTDTNVNGAHVTYFVVGFSMLALFINIGFNLKETKPENPQPRESFNLVAFFKSTFSERQWLIIYLLVFCSVALSAGLPGYLTSALILNQFGYNTQEYGQNIATPEILLNLIIIIPLAFALADRFDRRMLFRLGLWLSTVHALSMWGVVQIVGIPPIWMWIVMVSIGALVDQVAGIALEPLIFDLIPPDKMGTVNSGFVIVSRLLNLVIMPCTGLFINFYSYARFGRSEDPNLQRFDYSSGYLLVFILGLAACLVYAYFEHLYRQGKIVAYGKTASTETIEPVLPAAEDLMEETAKPEPTFTAPVKSDR